MKCAYCEGPVDGHVMFTIHRDGYGKGPEVPLCRDCGRYPTPTCEEIWQRIRERRFDDGERICVECGVETPDTYGGLCIGCDVAAEGR